MNPDKFASVPFVGGTVDQPHEVTSKWTCPHGFTLVSKHTGLLDQEANDFAAQWFGMEQCLDEHTGLPAIILND